MRKRRARRGFRVHSVLTAVLLLAVIAACGQADDEETAATTGQAAQQQTAAAASTTSTAATTASTSTSTSGSTATTATTTTASTTAAATTAAASPTVVAQPKVVESTATEEHPNAIITVEGTPVYGGTLRKGDGVARTIDTYVIEARGTGNTINTSPFRESLLTYKAPFDPQEGVVIQGNLAKSWEFSSDGSMLTLRLHEGVTWHDGMPMTSADVKATFDRLLDPDFQANAESAGGLRPIIHGVEVVDDHTVVLDLGGSTSYILIPYLANPSIQVLPKHILDAKGDVREDWTGTGPYKLMVYEKDEVMEFERNPNYWGTDQEGRALPYLDGLQALNIRDKAARIAAITANRLDLWGYFPAFHPEDAEGLKRQLGDDIRIQEINPSVWFSMDINTQTPPFDDRKVRLALLHALDTASVMAQALGPAPGGGLPGYVLDPRDFAGWTLSQEEIMSMPGFDPSRRAEDQAMARQLLAEAGYPDGVDISEGMLTSAGNRDYEDVTLLLTRQLQEVGFRVDPRPQEYGVWLAMKQKGEFHTSMTGYTPFVADPLGVLTYHGSWGEINSYTQWNDTAYDDMWREASQTLDVARRQELVLEMQRYRMGYDSSAPVVGWWTNNEPVWSYVKNYHMGPGMMGGWSLRHVWVEAN